MRLRDPLRLMMLLAVLAGVVGCHTGGEEFRFEDDEDLLYLKTVATEIETPDLDYCWSPDESRSLDPRALDNPHGEEPWNLSMVDTVSIALSNSEVIRELGGLVLRTPQGTQTVYEPALTESDPRFGVEAALSAFDAQFSSRVFWNRNERPTNRAFQQFIASVLEQDLGNFQAELSKTAATGTRFALRNGIDYEWNNNSANIFPSAWVVRYDAEVRQPLLQGAGVEFNRIAGPNGSPGFFFSNGVVLARINTDISLADFEAGVRNLVSNVENAYWDLYFAYRDLDAKIAGRESTLEAWQYVRRRADVGARGGEPEDEAQAREQYYRFKSQVNDALSGVSGGSTLSGATAGIFVGAGGVYAREENLRFLMGLPPNDGRLIRPADMPSTAKLVFDWDEVLDEALVRRVELRRQQWIIKRREMELVAARNFMLPRLDAVGRYRWRGFGDDLIDPNGPGGFDNAYQNLTSGDFQEWGLGLQLDIPIGFRQASAGVRNSQLKLARERAILNEQRRKVTHDVSASIREMKRSFQEIQDNYNRLVAVREEVRLRRAFYQEGRSPLFELLDAQRRETEAESDYHRSLVEYNLSIKNVHFQKGSLLEYNGVYLAEGPWSDGAYDDALRRGRHFVPRLRDYRYSRPAPVSAGPYMQHVARRETIVDEHGHETIQRLPPPAEADAPQ